MRGVGSGSIVESFFGKVRASGHCGVWTMCGVGLGKMYDWIFDAEGGAGFEVS